jgi:hypothetical protein
MISKVKTYLTWSNMFLRKALSLKPKAVFRSSVIGHPSSVIGHPSSVIGRPSSPNFAQWTFL